MPKKKIYTIVKSIRVSERCNKAWKYLEKHNINASDYFREGGENSVINKAIEFNYNSKKEYCPF